MQIILKLQRGRRKDFVVVHLSCETVCHGEEKNGLPDLLLQTICVPCPNSGTVKRSTCELEAKRPAEGEGEHPQQPKQV